MSSTYGENLKLSIFGQSHGPAIGMTLDGIPAGLPVDTEKLQAFLNRRAPGQNAWSTPRKEGDQPEFLGGILDGFTCGAPIAAIIRNTNTKSGDYNNLKDCPRPGHADLTAQVRRLPGRRRRRSFLRQTDGAPVHCRGPVQAVAGGNGHPHRLPYQQNRRCSGCPV